LLSKLDSLLTGDDISTLRILTKTVKSLVSNSEMDFQSRTTMNKCDDNNDDDSNSNDNNNLKKKVGIKMLYNVLEEQDRIRDEEEAEARAMGWMIVAAVAHTWKQNDLWEELI
jgi:hypothetical protein